MDDLGQWYYKRYDTIWEVVHCFRQNTEMQAWITRGNSYDRRKRKLEDFDKRREDEDDEECDFWSRVERGLWDIVENGVSPDPSNIPVLEATIQAQYLATWRYFVGGDMKALRIMQPSLPDWIFRETMESASAKKLWDLLEYL